MKIIAIGRNYVDHAKELNNPVPSRPVIFLKPDTALLKDNKPFYYPSFSKDIHYELELIIKIGKEGKNIQEKFARNYIDGYSLGVDFTARDIQQNQKEKGLPWELAKGFDHSAVIGKFIDFKEDTIINDLKFRLELNGNKVQEGDPALMIFSIENIIAFVSQYFTLKKGDIIFTGTPSGVGPISIGDRLEGFLQDKQILNFEIK